MPWRNTLRELVESGSYGTQKALVRALSDNGHDINQGTVSRELARMGAAKLRGTYRLPTPADFGAPVHELRLTANGCLGVVVTDPGFASVVGVAIDDAAVPGVLGTIAGDDTVFVAFEGPGAAERLRGLLGVPRRR